VDLNAVERRSQFDKPFTTRNIVRPFLQVIDLHFFFSSSLTRHNQRQSFQHQRICFTQSFINMRVLSLVAILTACAAAQGPTATASSCQAQQNFDACLTTEKQIVANCAATDYDCLCHAQAAVIQCYNLCPNDSTFGSAQAQQTSWCTAASQLATTMTSTTSGASQKTSLSTKTTNTVGTMSPSTTPSGGAIPIYGGGGGLLAAAVGVAAMI